MRQYTRFEIKDDKLVRTNVFEDDKDRTWVTGSSDIVMDKETFIKCFQKWIRYEDEPSREGMTVLPVGNPVTEVKEVHI